MLIIILEINEKELTNSMKQTPSWNLVVAQVVKKLDALMEPWCSLPWSQKPVTKPHPEPLQISRYTHTLFLRSFLILSSHTRLHLSSFNSGFPTNILHAFLISPVACYPAQNTLLYLITIIIQFIYLSAWEQPNKANYSQALKRQYRILKSTNDLKSRINIKKQTRHNPDVQYETYRVWFNSIQSIYLGTWQHLKS
jgi:hypothetical protein